MALPLRELPDYLAPPGADLVEIAASDGVRIRAACWTPSGQARGSVLLLQGRAEFIEKYYEVIAELLGRGFRVVTFDWRGQGGSSRSVADGRLGHVGSFGDFRLDYEAVRDRFAGPGSDRPLVVLAHSMGACIALAGAREGWLGAERLVAACPMLGLSIVGKNGAVRLLARYLVRLGLAKRIVPGGVTPSISMMPFEGNRLGRDPARYDRNARLAAALGAAAIGSPTIGWLAAAYSAMDRLAAPGAAAAIRMPVLVLAAGDDPVCATPVTERFARELPEGRLVTIPGARHEIMMETDAIRAQFWNAFDAFVDRADAPTTEAAEVGR